jgi:hypothetical protein
MYLRGKAHSRTSYLTMTHVGCSSGNAMRPTTAVAAMSSGLFTFQRNKSCHRRRRDESREPVPDGDASEQDAGTQDMLWSAAPSFIADLQS